MFSRKVLFLLLAGLLLAPGFAEATLIRAFSLPELHRAADEVVTGTVAAADSFWNEGHDTIYTDYSVTVESTVKGSRRKTIVVRLMGGTVGDRELVVAGNATLEPGERVLLFLRTNGAFHTVVGMSLGKWTVRRHGGIDHVFRGPALGDVARQEGEIPLMELLDKVTEEETR